MPTKLSYFKALVGSLCLAGTAAAEPELPCDRYNCSGLDIVGLRFGDASDSAIRYTTIVQRLIGETEPTTTFDGRLSTDIFDFPNPVVADDGTNPRATNPLPTDEVTNVPAGPDAGIPDRREPTAAVRATAPGPVRRADPPLTNATELPATNLIAADDLSGGADDRRPTLEIAPTLEKDSTQDAASRNDGPQIEFSPPANEPPSANETPSVEEHAELPSIMKESTEPTVQIERSARPTPDPTVLPVETAESSRRAYRVNAGISAQAKSVINQGIDAAERGAIYSARAQFVKVLRLVSQSLDVEADSRVHSTGLAKGLRALKEANDFRPDGSQLEANLDLKRVVMSHRTPILKRHDLTRMSPLEAQQAYHAYAEEQLAIAGGHELSAADALYGLGKLQAHLDVGRTDRESQVGPTGMSLYQAALMIYPEHFMAANELGVLFAKFGQLKDAQFALEHAAKTNDEFPEPWLNLAKVHERMGDEELATLAMREYRMRVAGRARGSNLRQPQIDWVDNETFARGEADERKSDVMANAPTAAPTQVHSTQPVVARKSHTATQRLESQPRKNPLQRIFR